MGQKFYYWAYTISIIKFFIILACPSIISIKPNWQADIYFVTASLYDILFKQ